MRKIYVGRTPFSAGEEAKTAARRAGGMVILLGEVRHCGTVGLDAGLKKVLFHERI